ncbi:carbohydrate ABC transporter ATP-binding protein (CUT1 family) [Aliiruegeria haliotis]|uniref:Carbohydrate ABC transporter ATP-binding protein (CUT1 family) n=1 Tax=Aliiruegeria haliotis TaxID=1280846 RepID=A0A2T0RUL3_9RHOB|nr:sn-glycerol-3-phosphate ABC transporter ATP-binding protein UgpC [Aliiruegeria haliotis]PRY24889.1 carbohydrate ABC transporter ATP-binding protein (CUT1 family) [Aliiruegeria haliotis]
MASLTIDNLVKSFGSVDVLKGINLEIEDGGFLVLVGPSGCGKSTLLNCIAGLEKITSGEIRIGDRNVEGLHPSKRDIAMVFQSYALYPNMTVRGNISFGMEIRGIDKVERDKAIQEVADMLQIGNLLDRKPSQLSGGQRQRVAMGRALVRHPQVFLFDEPLSNLDAKLRVDMRTEIKRLHNRMATTIVYVTHDQIEALTLATKIAVLEAGYLQQFGTPDEIYNDPANMFVADFMGSPSMNLINGTLEQVDGSLQVRIEGHGGSSIALPVPETDEMRAHVGGPIVFGIRPEAMTDPDGADRTSPHIETRDCFIEVSQPAGSDTFALTPLGGKECIARFRADARIELGAFSPISFNMAKAVYFDPATTKRIR